MSHSIQKQWFLLNLLNFFITIAQIAVIHGTEIPDDLKEILPLTNLSDSSAYIIIINNPGPDRPNETRRYTNHQDFVDHHQKRWEARAKAAKAVKWKKQHANRLAFINQTIANGYWSALYLYKEMKRIQRQRVVMDKMRKMIAHLDQPLNEDSKAFVLDCYRAGKPVVTVSYWKALDTNNMVRHDIMDPYNDNTKN